MRFDGRNPRPRKRRPRPEFKTCKYTSEAIVTDGSEKGELRKVCASPDCAVHHPKKQQTKADAAWKAEQEKSRRAEALAQATGLRILAATAAAVPVRLMKRDLLFLAERVSTLVDERRLEIVARQCGIKKTKDGDSIAKLFAAYLRRSDEGTLGRLLVETVILLTAARHNSAQALRAAATFYRVDVDAIGQKVKQEFASKENARQTRKPTAKVEQPRARKSA